MSRHWGEYDPNPTSTTTQTDSNLISKIIDLANDPACLDSYLNETKDLLNPPEPSQPNHYELQITPQHVVQIIAFHEYKRKLTDILERKDVHEEIPPMPDISDINRRRAKAPILGNLENVPALNIQEESLAGESKMNPAAILAGILANTKTDEKTKEDDDDECNFAGYETLMGFMKNDIPLETEEVAESVNNEKMDTDTSEETSDGPKTTTNTEEPPKTTIIQVPTITEEINQKLLEKTVCTILATYGFSETNRSIVLVLADALAQYLTKMCLMLRNTHDNTNIGLSKGFTNEIEHVLALNGLDVGVLKLFYERHVLKYQLIMRGRCEKLLRDVETMRANLVKTEVKTEMKYETMNYETQNDSQVPQIHVPESSSGVNLPGYQLLEFIDSAELG